ncbi:MAG TPA: hypothetical protein VFF98_14550, partial [Novosphingobium sp.]|nr:hypothetical protein [Novosphingobium sp.]
MPVADAAPQGAAILTGPIPPIPVRQRRLGPLTRRRLGRFYLALALVYAAAVAPVVAGLAPAWQALGLGIIFPGGGFLYAGGVVGVAGALLSLVAFAWIL